MTVLQLSAAAALVCTATYISYSSAILLVPRRPTLMRWLATVVIGLWLATASFHLLAAFRAFTLPVALCGSGLLLVPFLGRGPRSRVRAVAARDRRFVRGIRFSHLTGWHRVFAVVFAACGLLLVLRTMTVPPLAWDTLTYHAVKSALWVQNSGALPLRAPGGWSGYREYFGGGEILMAWAMLPFHRDLVALSVDGVQWLALGLAALCLSRELGAREPYASTATAFLMSVPTIQRLIGSGYTELVMNLSLVSGAVFTLRFLRRPKPGLVTLALVPLGVAAGVKITAWPIVGVCAGALALAVLLRRAERRASVRSFLVGAVAAAIVVVPWLWTNVRQTGYPLSPMSVTLAHVTLGRANPELEWYADRPGTRVRHWSTEWKTLVRVFRLPPFPNENLGGLTLISIAVAPFAVAANRWRPRSRAALIWILLAGAVASYYAPGLAPVRVDWPVSSSRFLLPLACFAVPVSVAGCRPRTRWASWYLGFLIAGCLLHLALIPTLGWSDYDLGATAAIAAFVALFTLSVWHVRVKQGGRTRVLCAAGILAGTLLLVITDRWRASYRYDVARNSVVLDRVRKYWLDAAHVVDVPGSPATIAVTAGPWQNADNWFLYNFIGRNFQNTLVYVPISRDGLVHPFGRNHPTESLGDPSTWLTRLDERRIDWIMTFEPPSVELAWMEQRPDRFEQVVGDHKAWGLYRTRRPE